jgi:hypothetical protein
MFDGIRQALSRAFMTKEMAKQFDSRTSQSARARAYTPLTQRLNDLQKPEFEEMQRVCTYLRRKNGLARRAIELMTDFIIGDGLTFDTFGNEMLEKVLSKHWADPINDWDSKQHARAERLLGIGEQLWPIQVGADSIVRIGNISPQQITKVLVSEFDTAQAIEVHFRESNSLSSKEKRYAVIRRSPDTGRFERGHVMDETGTATGFIPSVVDGQPVDGLCFFHRINIDAEQSRGVSELYPVADYLDAIDYILSQATMRTALLNEIAWHVKITSANPGDIKQRAEELNGEPRGGVKFRVTGETEEWKPMSFDLGSDDIIAISKGVQNQAMGALGIPEHWMGEGTSENRATAAEMGAPVFRRLKRRQSIFAEMVKQVLEYQRDLMVERGILKDLGEDKMRIEVISPVIEQPSAKEIVDILKGLTETLVVARQNNWIGEEVPPQLIRKFISELGVVNDTDTLPNDIDEEENAKDLQDEKDLDDGIDSVDDGIVTDPTEEDDTVVSDLYEKPRRSRTARTRRKLARR